DSGPNGTEVDAVNQVAASLDNGPTGMRIANHELLWTPVPQQLGRHTYRLTATDRAGNQVTSSFSIEVTPDPNVTPLVEIALVVVDGDGMEVDQLEVGEPFQLLIIAKDLRTGADLDGIRAVYADVLFEGAIETRGAGPIQYGDDFTVDQKGSIEASGIDELGAAFEGSSPTFLDSVVVATVDLVATSLGSVTIRTEPAEGFTSEVQLVGIDEAVSPSQVTYSQLDLQINASMHRLELPTDVNGRDGVTPLDALLIINLLSRRGANLNVYELDLSEFDPDLQYDVNGSGDISPLDALGVINAIARSASGESSGEGERARLVDRTFETNWDNEDELHGWVSSHRLF
ncbi:MAG: dockerin type I domain-containing protein, partial [Planctomycetota bacterium]